MVPNVCFLISRRWKKISTNGFHHCKLHPSANLSLEYERNRTKLRYWKIVANEKCTANWVQLKNYSERTTHQKMLAIVLNGWYMNGLVSMKSWIEYFPPFWKTKEEIAKKRLQISLKSSKTAVFLLLVTNSE